MKEIIKQIDDGRLLLEVDKNIYDVKAILNATHKFADRCYVHQESASENTIRIYFKAKEDSNVPLDRIANDFCNELIDQQIRLNVEKEYGNIRDEIVKKAFSPIKGQ